METRIQVDPDEDPNLHRRLSQAAETLEGISEAELSEAEKTFREIVGPRATRFVRAKWSQVEDQGSFGPKHMVLLRLTDPLSEIAAEEKFEPVELKSPPLMKTRLIHVWREFLQKLSHKQMDRLHETVKTLEGD
jgi:hypothetical protein